MQIYNTPIPGMAELSGVGYGAGYEPPLQKMYDQVMTSAALKKFSIVVASLTTDQEHGIKLLLKNGFKQIGKAALNHNSGHMILLFTKLLHSR